MKFHPQVYYLRMDKEDGFYLTGMRLFGISAWITLSMRNIIKPSFAITI